MNTAPDIRWAKVCPKDTPGHNIAKEEECHNSPHPARSQLGNTSLWLRRYPADAVGSSFQRPRSTLHGGSEP